MTSKFVIEMDILGKKSKALIAQRGVTKKRTEARTFESHAAAQAYVNSDLTLRFGSRFLSAGRIVQI